MDRIFFNSDIEDDSGHCPIYVFDTSYLPSPEEINYDELIMTLMAMLPTKKYTLLMFCSGLNKISWVWGLKFLKKFMVDESNFANIHKIISVHEGWFIKTLTSILKNYNLTKKNINLVNKLLESLDLNVDSDHQDNLIINVNSLLDLSRYVDITKIKISLNIYKHDLQLGNPRLLPMHTILSSKDVISNPFKNHIYQIYNILTTYGPKVELILHRPGNKISSEIFLNCIKRDQLIWINDWNLYCLGTSYKRILSELPTLIPVELIKLPIQNEAIESNLQVIVNRLSKDLKVILITVFKLCDTLVQNSEVTRLNSKLLAKSLCNCLSHQPYLKSNEPNLIIVNNFIRKVIDIWPQLRSVRHIEMDDLFNDYEAMDETSYIDYDLTVHSMDEPEEIGVDENIENEMEPKAHVETSPKKVLATNTNVLNTMASIESFSSVKTLIPNESEGDFSPIRAQYPPQKYKFNVTKHSRQPSVQSVQSNSSPVKFKPVIRGIKVGELAKLYEERAQGLELLKSL